MTATWFPAGQSSDFSADAATLVKNLLHDQWDATLSGLTADTDILFGTDWWNDYGDYQIHCTDQRDGPSTVSNNWKRFEYHTQVDIHIFIRRVTEDRPSQILSVINEVKRIVGTQPQGITGVSLVSWAVGGGLAEIPEPDSQKTTWHFKGTVELMYHMVNSS